MAATKHRPILVCCESCGRDTKNKGGICRFCTSHEHRNAFKEKDAPSEFLRSFEIQGDLMRVTSEMLGIDDDYEILGEE